MSRLELDDQILNHRKFVRAVRLGGSEAIHMWLGIRAYVGQNLSDGFVPSDMVDDIRGPTGKKRTLALNALSEVGLIHRIEDGELSRYCARCAALVEALDIGRSGGLLMHDFTDWSRSKSQVLADRERARERQARSRGPSRRDNGRTNGVTSGGVTKASASASASASEEEETPTPSEPDRPKPPDPFMRSFAALRSDVVSLHEAYKRTFGLRGHKLSGPSDLNAIILAEAIDSHGFDECSAALRVAKQDGMVNGSADERRARHEKISYVFGNPDTLARLLRLAENERKKQRAAGGLEAAMNAEPDLSDYVEPEAPCPQQ